MPRRLTLALLLLLLAKHGSVPVQRLLRMLQLPPGMLRGRVLLTLQELRLPSATPAREPARLPRAHAAWPSAVAGGERGKEEAAVP